MSLFCFNFGFLCKGLFEERLTLMVRKKKLTYCWLTSSLYKRGNQGTESRLTYPRSCRHWQSKAVSLDSPVVSGSWSQCVNQRPGDPGLEPVSQTCLRYVCNSKRPHCPRASVSRWCWNKCYWLGGSHTEMYFLTKIKVPAAWVAGFWEGLMSFFFFFPYILILGRETGRSEGEGERG